MNLIPNKIARTASRNPVGAAFAVAFSLLALSAQPALAHPTHDLRGIDFGNNSSEWAFDGECDDPRFAGPGTADELYWDDAYRDASDCERAYRRDRIWLR